MQNLSLKHCVNYLYGKQKLKEKASKMNIDRLLFSGSMALNVVLLFVGSLMFRSRMSAVPYSMKMEAFAQNCNTHMIEASDVTNKQVGIFYIHVEDSTDAEGLARIYTLDGVKGNKPAFAMYVDSSSKFFQDLQSRFIIPCK